MACFMSALFLMVALRDASEPIVIRKQVEEWATGKALVGMTEQELVRRLGEPTSKKDGVWEYRQPLGPGFHEFVYKRVVRFKDGKAIAAPEVRAPVGCIIVEEMK